MAHHFKDSSDLSGIKARRLELVNEIGNLVGRHFGLPAAASLNSWTAIKIRSILAVYSLRP